jgi:undecaprenyl-diphosphatase
MSRFSAGQIALAALLGAMAVIALTLSAIAITGHLAPGDHPIADALQSLPGGPIEEAADVLASAPLETLVWLGAMALAWRQRNTPLLIAGLLVAVSLTANPLIKELVDRARPAAGDARVREHAGGEGFPSGHVQGATLIYGFAWCSLRSAVVPGRAGWAVVLGSIVAAGVVLVIAFDRIYNGVHWPSDVAGGFAFGVLLLAASVFVGRALAGSAPFRRMRDGVAGGAAPRPG